MIPTRLRTRQRFVVPLMLATDYLNDTRSYMRKICSMMTVPMMLRS
nr:MAG TPA: hypothetical protein [Caudoviricetes sp.]